MTSIDERHSGSYCTSNPIGRRRYYWFMIDLKLEVPNTDRVQVDAETLAAIDRGIKDADEGRTVSIDEVREMIPKWISKFESQKSL